VISLVPIVVVSMVATLAATAPEPPQEPPPESADGADYVAERADSLDDGNLEWRVGAAGRPGGAPRRRRGVSFNTDSLAGGLRDGDDDPLSGGTLGVRGWGGAYGYGRLSPRWGRGLVLGAAAEPWSTQALDRGRGSTFRGRAGDGAWLKREGVWGVESFVGRFSRRMLGAAMLRRGGAFAGTVGGATNRLQTSVGYDRDGGQAELAVDHAGRWRAESWLERPWGPAHLGLRARGGVVGFQSVAEPRRSGPARAIAADLDLPLGAARSRWHAAAWRFAAGAAGSRLGADWTRTSPRAGTLAVGIEQQRGPRRLPSPSARPAGLRQGVWIEWSGGGPDVALGLRHESWGSEAFARARVREVSSARVDVAVVAGAHVQVTHTVYRSPRGESFYLPELETDRLVLRALSGAGQRTRAELVVPVAGGRVRGGLALSPGRAAKDRVQWTVDWSRRVRLARRTP
jgi:hypothetical protein